MAETAHVDALRVFRTESMEGLDAVDGGPGRLPPPPQSPRRGALRHTALTPQTTPQPPPATPQLGTPQSPQSPLPPPVTPLTPTIKAAPGFYTGSGGLSNSRDPQRAEFFRQQVAAHKSLNLGNGSGIGIVREGSATLSGDSCGGEMWTSPLALDTDDESQKYKRSSFSSAQDTPNTLVEGSIMATTTTTANAKIEKAADMKRKHLSHKIPSSSFDLEKEDKDGGGSRRSMSVDAMTSDSVNTANSDNKIEENDGGSVYSSDSGSSAMPMSYSDATSRSGEGANESCDFNNSQASFGTILERMKLANQKAYGSTDEDDAITQLQPSDVVYLQKSVPKVARDRYLVGDVLGRGSFAKVREAYDLREKRIVAFKIFQWPWLKRVNGGELSLKRELTALRAMPRHPNVVSMTDYWRDPDKQKSILVIDYLPCGSLEQLLARVAPNPLPLSQAKLLFKSLMKGLEHMHTHRVYHRDIKPDNLLLESCTKLAISDFGTATDERSTEGIGAPSFQPPEVAETGKAPFSEKLDVWAAGITLYMMVTGRYPFREDGTVYQKFEQIAHERVVIPDTLPPSLQDLLAGMLDPDPAQRLGVKTIRRHPWLKEHDATIEYVDVRARQTIFTPANVKRFRSEIGQEQHVDLVRGDEIPDEEDPMDDQNAEIRIRKESGLKPHLPSCCTLL